MRPGPVTPACFFEAQADAVRRTVKPNLPPMFTNLLRDPVPYHGIFGFVATITIDRLNAVVGLLVGVATLFYLCYGSGEK